MNKPFDTAKIVIKAPQDGVAAPAPAPAPHPPSQSQVDRERGDWEGMAQDHHQPEPATPAPKVGKNRKKPGA